MSSQIAIAKNEQNLRRSPHVMSTLLNQDRSMKVLIPYDGSENAEVAFDEMSRAGLPQNLEALVAVTNVWLPLSPYEITRAVNARRMMLLTSGMTSFAPALGDVEEERVLKLEAESRVRAIFPSGTIKAEGIQDVAAVANEILRKSKTWGAHLIIVGAKASPSPHITDFAGPALRVAQDAHCSVRIARASDRITDSSMRIMIGVDESDSPEQVVQAVAERFWPAGREARIVAVRNSDPRDPVRDSRVALVLNRLADKLRSIGLEVSFVIRYGPPQDVLLQEAREFSADCIFIDSHGWDQTLSDGSIRRGLGKVAEALVLGAHCSVEVVRPKNLTDQYLNQRPD
jgi:nucleotide-binding universal stress UspA family protein